MNNERRFIAKFLFLLLIAFLSAAVGLCAQNKQFTLVLDAGHGGHDPGSMGKTTREKNVALAVVLALGDLVTKNFDDVKVVYTRKTDVYLTLQERADIANNNKADFFISVHTNAAESTSPYGAETYTLGLHKTQANLNVAKRENSVILLESDYQTKYKGFNPNSVESYIMFDVMQDKYLDRSIEFAAGVQKQFTSSGRYNRGVRQAGFWVLHATAAPSVLVELGFISNANEEQFLASKAGQTKMATSLYNAFAAYKHDHDKRSGKPSKPTKIIANETTDSVTVKEKSESNELEQNLPVFKVQFYASKAKLKEDDKIFDGIENVDVFYENGLYKYTSGSTSDENEILKIQGNVRKKYKDAFTVAFLGNKKITPTEAREKLRVKSL
jgi:N-acetylmuramoyl-L-alanine amidase